MADDRIEINDCEFRLSRYLDGELDRDEARRLERELDADQGLRRLRDDYRRTDEWVKASAGPVPEPDWNRFAGQVLWRCGAAAAKPRRAVYGVLTTLAAAAAIALAFTLYSRSTRQPASTDSTLVNVAPERSADTADAAAVVSVVIDRTPRETELDESDSDETDDEGSFVIAAAGARPLDDEWSDEESPTF